LLIGSSGLLPWDRKTKPVANLGKPIKRLSGSGDAQGGGSCSFYFVTILSSDFHHVRRTDVFVRIRKSSAEDYLEARGS
jgi:hypothetical protein